MHCANQPKCAYRSAEQISHIYKKSRLYRTASLDGQSRTCYPLLSPPRTEGCHHKGRFNLPHIYKKRAFSTLATSQEFCRATATLLAAQKLLRFHPQQKRTENNINIYFTVKQLRPRCQVSTP